MTHERERPRRRRLLSRAQILQHRLKNPTTVSLRPRTESEEQQKQHQPVSNLDGPPEASPSPPPVENESTSAFWRRSTSPPPPRLGETSYQYKELDSTRNEIRLLRVQPGWLSEISCEIISTSLDDPEPYTAISYAWGDPEDTRTITIHEHAFPVTYSLYLALRRLRGAQEPITIWADAVCINQQDVRERNHQVQAMRKIYRKAHGVAVWLGPESSNSGQAVSLLYMLREGKNSPTTIRSIIQSPSNRHHFEALLALFEREYWNRLWVVQEVMHGKDIRVYCGRSSVSWDTYTTASEILQHYGADLVRITGDLSTISSRYHSWVEALAKTGPRALRPATGAFPGLFDALRYHRWKSCADPRDKVYGLLGIIPQYEREEIVVDYNKSVVVVYINVVEHLLSTTRRMNIVCASIHYPVRQSIERLPSWAPNWSNPSQREPLGYYNLNFSAAGITNATYAFSERRKKLVVSAIPIASITVCGTPAHEIFSLDDILMAFFQWRMKFVAQFGYDDEIAHERFCRTLCCDRTAAKMSAPQDWMKWIYSAFGFRLADRFPTLQLDAQLVSYANSPNALWEAVHGQSTFDQYIVTSLVGRRFFITSSGELCLGSGAAKIGDIICIPLGCSTPVILRKEDSEYFFVGDVYVDGYMYGKAIDELDAGTRELQTFVLH